MGGLRVGDCFERECECIEPICDHWKRKAAWKIWFAWILRLLGWDGPPA